MEKQEKNKKMEELFPDTKPIVDEEETPKRPERKRLENGTTAVTAFVVKEVRDISDILSVVFGFSDGDYFIRSSTTRTIREKTYKIHRVEDKYGYLYDLWFDTTKTSLLHGITYGKQ